MYVIKRIDQSGGYVAEAGHQSSYVKNVTNARKFITIEEAEKNLCVENEVIVNLEHILYGHKFHSIDPGRKEV